MIAFKKRWNHFLSYCKPELLTKARAHSLILETLDHFFDMLTDVYSQSDLVPEDAAERILNCDKTGCSTDPAGKSMFFKKSSKENYLMTPNCGKAIYTVLVAGSAAGEYLPPQFLFNRKHLYEFWTALGPVGATYAVAESGWMTDTVFENWFSSSFLAFVAGKKKKTSNSYI